MNLSYEWLKEFVKTKLSPETVAEKLTLVGLEVESVEKRQDFSKVVIGEILELKKHPNADKLHLTKVNVGTEKLDIVCGANNLSLGIKVPVALVGAKIGESKIKKATIRGVVSNGMIASEWELGLGENHTGILILAPDAPVGKNLEDYLDFDAVMNISVPANRPDCYGIIGLAREVAAACDEDFHEPEIELAETGGKTAELVEIEIAEPDLCPRYVARVVKNLKVAASPQWLQKRLSANGIRPINNLVDISNYVMLEYGQPLHFFDLKKLAKTNHRARIIVRKAKAKEKIITLDKVSRELSEKTLVIADAKGVVAIAGIMGGAKTEVDESTSEILIEAAVFDKSSVRKSARNLGLSSEAVARFEKGLPLTLPEIAIDRAAELLSEFASGKVTAGRVDKLEKWIWIQHIGLRVSKLKEVLGTQIPEHQIIAILERLGFMAEKFDIVQEAKKHLGKPYLFGANFRTNGTSAFDCSYLTDYIYSLIGQQIGHTSLGQLHHGRDVAISDLKPGDNLFYKGHIKKSAVGEYYVTDENGNHIKKKTSKYRSGVGHNGLYLGNGKVIHASSYDFDEKTKKWSKRADEKTHMVDIVPLQKFTQNPEFLGARRYVEDLQDYIAVTVPWWRHDIKEESDLYEEVARVWGYEKIPSSLPKGGSLKPARSREIDFVDRVKDLLAGIGLDEIATYSFVSKKESELLDDHQKEVKVINPIVKDKNLLRNSLIPQMISSLAENQYKKDNLAFFEIGRIYDAQKTGQLPKEIRHLATGTLSADTYPFQFSEGQVFYAAKGILDHLFSRLMLTDKVKYKKSENKIYRNGRGALIEIEGKKIGILGEIDEKIAADFGLKRSAALFDLDFDLLFQYSDLPAIFCEISRFPSISRDLSAVFEREVPVGEVAGELGKEAKELKVEIVDIFEGKPFLPDEKSVTFRLVFSSLEKTLTDDEVEKVIGRCQNKIKKLGGKIRSGNKN